MTPDELALIESDGAIIRAAPEAFATTFYATLFELAPETRALFPDDLVAQRGKLVAELEFLIDAATDTATTGDLGPFLVRARELGRRHVDYGVTGPDYATVGLALNAAAGRVVDGWDERHDRAWTKLYRLISDVMREGADDQLFTGG